MKTKTFLPTISPARFARMGNLAKRAAIARDVVARINGGFIIASPEELFLNVPVLATEDSAALKQAINEQPCEVCAKGALACSLVGNLNRYDSLQHHFGAGFMQANESGTAELCDIFGAVLWSAVEVAFEQQAFNWTDQALRTSFNQGPQLGRLWSAYGPTRLGQLVIDSFKRYYNPTKRMRAVYANVAENKGRMKLKDGTFIG